MAGRSCVFWLALAVAWPRSSAVVFGSASGSLNAMCEDFSSFPESVAVSTGSDVCFLCDYPGTESEAWTNSCASDQDGMCTCNFNDLAAGVELCFTSFHQDCSGTYQCNVTLELTGQVCSAEADIVATNDRFTEQPAAVSAVEGNRVSFQCELLSGSNSVLWQRNNSTVTEFLTSTTPPGNYTFETAKRLTIDAVQPGHAGLYRCALEVQEGIFLYSDYGELDYLGEGVNLSFAGTSYSLDEGDSVVVCITSSGSIPENYTIDFSVVSLEGTALTGSDYQSVSFTRNLVAIENPACVENFSISTVDDSLVEADEQFTISMTSNSFIVSTTNATILITILNDDLLNVRLPSATYTVSEDAGSYSVCVISQGQLSGIDATFTAQTIYGSATDIGGDYDPVLAQYNISQNASEGDCVVEIEVMINDDSTPEPEQCFFLLLHSSDSRVSAGTAATHICIEDNDNVTVQFAQASYAFRENSVVAVNIIYDTRPEDLTIRYNVTQSAQTATRDEDYLAQNRTVAVTGSSNLTYQFPFDLYADEIVEGNETFSLHLSSLDPRVTLSTPITTITIIDQDKRVDIDFEQSVYTFSENDGTVDVCLVTSDEVTYNFGVSFDIALQFPELRSATAVLDFTSSVFFVTLGAGDTTVCTNGTLLEDSLVEGTESFYLVFSSNNPNIILNADSGQNDIRTQIFIEDSTVFEVRFGSSSYTVNEGAGSLAVCLEIFDSSEIAPDVAIAIYIVEVSDEPFDGVAFNLPNFPLIFDIDVHHICVAISVINDTTAHGDRSALLGVRTLDSQFLVAGDIATITFLDEQETVLCGDLTCLNGGECLDDFLCQCPPDYTGSECETRLIQDPILSISSSIPVLGEDYEAMCTLTAGSEISLEEMSSAVTIQWLGPDGEPANATEDVVVLEVIISSNRATLSLNISSLTTSHAGSYMCQASLVVDDAPTSLERSVDITFVLPAPVLVFILQVPTRDVAAGDTVSLRCTSIHDSSITTPIVPIVEWKVGDGQAIPDSARFQISSPSSFTSVLTISPALVADAGSYTCRVYFESTGELSEYLNSSSSDSDSHELSVNAMEFQVSLTAQTESVPNVPPYNAFELTCQADSLSSLPFQFRWVRETGPEQEETVTADSQTMIDTSDTEPVSVLTATRTEPRQYVFYCEVVYLYEGEEVTSATSNYQDVTVTSPANPAVPVDATVYGTSADFAIIQWTVSRVQFTPETYHIEYGVFTDDDSDIDLTRVQYPITNTNFSTIDAVYMFVVDGLSPDTLYGFRVVAENSNGETVTPAFVYFNTREQDPFTTPEDKTSFSYPIGAAIDLEFNQTDIIIDGSGDQTTTYVFVPELHVPLQQPRFAYSRELSVNVQYSFASPSLTGDYVLCSQSDTPYICGGRITLSITIPSLSISTELLVSQYVNGIEVNNISPEVVCLPSDSRAPVQWSTLPVYVDLERQYNASFDPPGLNHTLKFPSDYQRLPTGTLRVFCDLINVDEPGVEINPLETIVVFVQNPVALLNNDREMEPNAVINIFSEYEGVDHLSLVCVGAAGNGQLQWERRLSGETEGGVLGSSDGVTIEYFSDDRRDTLLRLQPVTPASAGYYSCRSTESDQEATVLVTFDDPYFAFTSPSYYEIPLGVRVDISARYAYSSNGVNNSGTGFTYRLTFSPFASTTDTPPPTNQTSPTGESTPPQEQLIESGSVNSLSNNFIFAVYGSQTSGGVYNLTFTYPETQEMYLLTTEIVVTVPYIVTYEEEVVARADHNVTLTCIPNDQRAPVLWSNEGILLHDDPTYFVFDPPSLRHTVTFVAISGSLDYHFDCGFMDGDDDRNIVNATTITLLVQDDKLQLSDTIFSSLRIFNNTVINLLGGGQSDNPSTPPPPQSKRQSPEQGSLSVDCSASQGDHEPVWTTTNLIVGGETGIVPSVGLGYRAERLSAYKARLTFDILLPEYEGVYTCRSELSGEFVEIFVTTSNPYVAAVSERSITVVEDSPVTLEFKVAVDSNGKSWNTEEIYFNFISQATMLQDEGIQFTTCDQDFPQNYCYTIESVSRLDEGQYTATAISQRTMSTVDTITLNVTRRCPVEVNSGIQWPWTLEDTTVSRPCTEAGSMFRAGPKASRWCNKQGEWEEADLTSCTIAEIEDPFLLVWFVIDADQYTDDQEQDFIDSMKAILDMNGVAYKRVALKSVYVASVAVTFQVDLVEEEQSRNISRLNSFVSNSESFSSFSSYSVMEDGRGSVDVTVAETCMCSSANLGSSLQLCSGAALSPCNCASDTCTCQAPFVGDGTSCTLDSDSDGYPDEALDSPSCEEDPSITYCNADVCPEITNPEQDPIACQPDVPPDTVFTGCPYGPDQVWGIVWPNTDPGTTNTQPCPGGVDTLGNATRPCYENGTWGNVNVLSCRSLAIVRVVEEAEELLPDADEEIEEVTQELVENTAVVSEQLVMATGSAEETGLLPLDLEATNNIVAQVLNVLESTVEAEVDNVPSEELVNVFNNILNETNQEGWTQLQTVGTGSQTLLQNAERYATYLATTVNDTNEPLMLVRENIVVAAEVVNTSSASDVVFPAQPDQLKNFSSAAMNEVVQITIPAGSLSRLNTGNSGAEVSLVHVIFRNIEEFLPNNTRTFNNSRAESLVFSSQLGGLNEVEIPADLFRDNPITLNFSFTASSDLIDRYVGVFWNFSNPVGNGEWSSEGIQVISNVTRENVTTILCNSTHLTSFAVLVDVAGGLEDVSREESLALQIVSYIGCIISTICLSITVVFYIAMGKKLFSAVHYFVHLNLSISLLLGYIVFLFGIELGNSSEGSCGLVAALLQYLFLSAFCWMMCEGIMLYLMLIVVFSKLSNKWWFFLILGYCTPLLFVVIGLAVRAEYYGVRSEDGELAYCWLSTEKGTIFAFVVPMIVIIIINTVFLVLALAALIRSKNQKVKAMDKKKSIKQAGTLLKATVILLPLLGVTWLFGLLTLNSNATVFAWLFTIFNSLQGTAIFFFHVIRSKTVWSRISPTISRIKQSTLKSSFKYNVSSSYTSSEGQSSTGTLRTLLRKKPLDSKENDYELSVQASSSLAVSETELESGTGGIDKKNLEPIPEADKDNGDSSIGLGKEEVIANPGTTGDGSQDSSEPEEITRM